MFDYHLLISSTWYVLVIFFNCVYCGVLFFDLMLIRCFSSKLFWKLFRTNRS
jgi:hypothetical protein